MMMEAGETRLRGANLLGTDLSSYLSPSHTPLLPTLSCEVANVTHNTQIAMHAVCHNSSTC